MATQTQTLRKPMVNAGRTHDYLYDPHYVVCSERDHARSTFKAHTSTDRIKRVPIYKTMFSELRHHPRFQMQLDVTDPVPKFISRQWQGFAEQQREAAIRSDPSAQVPPKTYSEVDVSGQNRYKYFRRPIIPFMQQVPPDVVLASGRQDPLAAAAGPEQHRRPHTPLVRTVYTQTDYRDSEAQTDPYTPEYVVRPGSAPELLTLATLSYGHGLPAGQAEVEMIERARAKRAWEATLPPLSDVSQLEKRRKMMDDMEMQEWSLREREIEKLQEQRLEVLKELLRQREAHHQELNTKRLDRLWAKKQEEKNARVKKIRNEHIKCLRKLTKKRTEVEGKLERRDVVKDYSDPGSQAYAPLTRIGVFLDRGSEQYVVKSRYLSSYQGLMELENSLPDFVTNPRVKAPKPSTVNKSGFVKRKYRRERELAEIYDVIKENRNKEEEPLKPLRYLQKIEKPVPRPPTPAVEVPSEEEEQRELAVIFLQQVIRGRAVQNMMFEGKEKRIELIQELRSTHALQEAEQKVKKQEKQATLALQRQRMLHENRESFIDEAMSRTEGSSLGDMLDFLSKELVRLQEERRIHAFSMLAERQRRIREAEESGRRQVEERRRREQDEVFKQVVKVHQMSVDTYLEDVILGAVDQTADLQARQEVQEVAEKINDVAYEMEDKRTALESEEIVAEMVHSFLLPEVQKQTMRDKVQRQQRKYLVAAHNEIHKDGEDVIAMHPVEQKPATPAGTPQQGSRSATPAGSQKQGSRSATPVGTPQQGSRSATPQRIPTPGTPVADVQKEQDFDTSEGQQVASPPSQLEAQRIPTPGGTPVPDDSRAVTPDTERSQGSGTPKVKPQSPGSTKSQQVVNDQQEASSKGSSPRTRSPTSSQHLER